MDGTFSGATLQATKPPGNRSQAHHAWFSAKASDRAANYAAYNLARADLSLKVCAQVFALHDSAQHHFISMLLWERDDGLLSIAEAVAKALAHHAAVTKI